MLNSEPCTSIILSTSALERYVKNSKSKVCYGFEFSDRLYSSLCVFWNMILFHLQEPMVKYSDGSQRSSQSVLVSSLCFLFFTKLNVLLYFVADIVFPKHGYYS